MNLKNRLQIIELKQVDYKKRELELNQKGIFCPRKKLVMRQLHNRARTKNQALFTKKGFFEDIRIFDIEQISWINKTNIDFYSLRCVRKSKNRKDCQPCCSCQNLPGDPG